MYLGMSSTIGSGPGGVSVRTVLYHRHQFLEGQSLHDLPLVEELVALQLKEDPGSAGEQYFMALEVVQQEPKDERDVLKLET